MIALMAWRNIWRNKSRSMVIILSIMLGLFAGISVLALYKGMIHARVRTVIDREAGHIQIHHPKFKDDYLPEFIIADTTVVSEIRKRSQISLVTDRAVTTGMLTTASNSAGVNILGIRPSEEELLSKLDQKIVDGTYFEGNTRNPIVIGKKLAVKMKLKIKSKLVLTFMDSTNTMVAAAFRVVGIYESDNAPFDERMVYTTHDNLSNLLGVGSMSHEIAIILKHDEDLEATTADLRQKFPSLSVETWKEISPETELMVDTTDQYSYIILIIIMLALAFGIINTMLMAILERTREIGMLVALGMNELKLFSLILYETMFLTFAGIPLGFIAAWLLTDYFNRNGLVLSQMDEQVLKSFGFQNLIYPEFPWDKVAGLVLIVAATALLSGLLPALKALRLRPTEALRK